MSRSVIVRMRRRHQAEKIEPFRRRIHGKEGARIRDEIGAWVRSLPNQVQWPDLPREIQDRAADIWEPLIAVADLAGGKWPRLAREAAVALVAAATDTEPSLGLVLLADTRTVFNDPALGYPDAMSSKELLEGLHRVKESPWSDLRGKPLDERGLAYRLRQYGVKPKTVRIGTNTPKGYTRADLHDVWLRYLPAQAPESATSATEATEHDVVDVADVALLAEADSKDDPAPPIAEQCCAHCHESGELQLCSVDGRSYYLHRECQKAWLALEIPSNLERRANSARP